MKFSMSTPFTVIEIYSERAALPRVRFDESTISYIKAISARPIAGHREILEGRVKTLYYVENAALVERTDGGPNVKVFLGVKDFEKVRQEPDRWHLFAFHGRPRLRLGTAAFDYREFDAEEVREASS
jgi:hypothetical protein